ncbi:MAG: nickel-dependent hydrogenase large subunit [Dongiaceae bacterium]
MLDAPSLARFAADARRLRRHAPWPACLLDRAGWEGLLEAMAGTSEWSLLGLWGEPGGIWLALRDEADGAVALFTLDCPDGSYPAVSPLRPAAVRLERATADLFGLVAEGAEDQRPWLDHGRWPVARPLARTPADPGPEWPADSYPFLAAEGEALHQIPVGPVHAGIIEPGHFRFSASGETVVRLEQRLGYVHKGSEGLMRGLRPEAAARIAARISGDSTVAHSLAFARAVEAALGVPAPPRADWLRALMAELERIANHLGDIGAICNDATFPLLQQQLMVLREQVLRAAMTCFGHRLMMDRVVPGGVAADLAPEGAAALAGLVGRVRPELARLMRIYEARPSLLDRMVGTGVTQAALVHRFAAGGHVGRAAGRSFDARVNPGYPPYDRLTFEVPVLHEGDVNARVHIRAREIAASLGLIEQILEGLPAGPIAVALPQDDGMGTALVEAFRGEILTWVRLDRDGRVARCHPRDASWFQWPLLEAAIEGNIVADFPLCNKSFNCSYSGHDL